MPNHVKSRLELIGSGKQVKKVVESLSTFFPSVPDKSHSGELIFKEKGMEYSYGWLDEETNMFSRRDMEDVKDVPDGFEQKFTDEWTRFPDFNKIIPAPESLSITIDSWLTPLENRFSGSTAFKSHLDEMRNVFEKAPNRKDEIMKNFIQGVKNYLNYGHATWYNWNTENWGTKWNCFSCEKEADNIFTFETAWSNVSELIRKISESFPNVEFKYEYSDEDTGSNCGSGMFKNGNGELNVLENGSKEAYDLAFKLRPDYKEDYKLVGENYEYVEED